MYIFKLDKSNCVYFKVKEGKLQIVAKQQQKEKKSMKRKIELYF